MIKKILSKAVTSLAGRDDFEIPEHDSPLFAEIDWDKLPRHVAVIMDGNGRWGKEHSVLRTAGHSAGVGTLKNILKTAIGLKLDALTVYAFSTENWKRPETEVNFLMNLMKIMCRFTLLAELTVCRNLCRSRCMMQKTS